VEGHQLQRWDEAPGCHRQLTQLFECTTLHRVNMITQVKLNPTPVLLPDMVDNSGSPPLTDFTRVFTRIR
jgi:hypothetical protein